MLTAIVGINWGDEGKGRMADFLSENQDVVARYQGGSNAGHTVVTVRGKFVLNLLPSGIFRDNVVNVMGNGTAVDFERLYKEAEMLRTAGFRVSPDNLKISDKATVCFPFHALQDCLEEDRLGDRKYGSTRRGIAPVYADKYMKKAVRAGDILHPEYLIRRLEQLIEWKDPTLKSYGAEKISLSETLDYVDRFCLPFKDYICDTGEYLESALDAGKNVLLEGQLGALKDVDFGIYPYTTSSNTLAAYGPIGAGIPGRQSDKVIGVMKAYSSCVGEGPFTAEIFGEEAEILRRAGGEYGAATGRPRRVGGFDVLASAYGCALQAADEIALTKLDVLDNFEKIPVCDHYTVNGEKIHKFPSGFDLTSAKPHVIYLDGWLTSTKECRSLGELPTNARAYVDFLEKSVGSPIKYVSVGPGRDELIIV